MTYSNQVGKPVLPCQIYGKRGHDTFKCWHRFNHTYHYDDIPQVVVTINLSNTHCVC